MRLSSRNMGPGFQTFLPPSASFEAQNTRCLVHRSSSCARGSHMLPKRPGSQPSSMSSSVGSSFDVSATRVRSGLAVCLNGVTRSVTRLAASPSGHTTDELSEPTLGQMLARECADCLVDDGLDDEETMLVRISLGRLKLAPKAIAPCLCFRRPTNVDRRWNRWLDRLGDHARTMAIDHGSSKP